MKNTVKIVAVFLLLTCLFCGCEMGDRTLICQDLSISLPVYFADLSGSDNAEGLDFFYMSANMGITGNVIQKNEISEDAQNFTVKDFISLMQQGNGHTGSVTQRGEIITYQYTTDVDGELFTYLVAGFDVEDHIWVVQCYCKQDEFQDSESAMWSYLETVTFSK